MLRPNPQEVAEIESLAQLLDECVFHNIKNGNVISPTDGNIEFVFSLGNAMQRDKKTSQVELSVILNASMIEADKTRFFYASVGEALVMVQEWHRSFFPEQYVVTVTDEKPIQLRIVK